LTGKFKPNPIHEIGRPIRIERPGSDWKLLQQIDLDLQLCCGLLLLKVKAAGLRQSLFASAQFFDFRLALLFKCACAVQHDSYARSQGLRPLFHGAERRSRPVERTHTRGHLAFTGKH
jgi:hypothetical protein